MPRPSKTVRRQKINAAQEWKKGNREEAKKLWLAADKTQKELQDKKRNKRKKAEEEKKAAEAPAEAPADSGESEG